jgi:hypothetical protein
MTFALVAFLAATASAEKFDRTCFGQMKGHTTEKAPLQICHTGGGTFRDDEAVVKTIKDTDWFPATAYAGMVAEILIVCRDSAPWPHARIVYPSASEKGLKARLELSCRNSAAEIKKRIDAANKLLRATIKDRDRVALAATIHVLPNCKAQPKTEQCQRYRRQVRDILAGEGNESFGGRAFSFTLKGFEILAGVADPEGKENSEQNSPDPTVRLRAFLQDDSGEKSIRTTTGIASAFVLMTGEQRRDFIDRAVDDSDPKVRAFGLDSMEVLPPERQRKVVDYTLDDPDPVIRSMVFKRVPAMGEAMITKALADSDRNNRVQMIDTVADYFEKQGSPAAGARYLESCLADPDEGVRTMAKVKLDYLRSR